MAEKFFMWEILHEPVKKPPGVGEGRGERRKKAHR
jgi:hypothetical protein